ncbi:hypothetical protein H2201_006925 [Coniosporium apollinis]|uniref:DUF3295 domain-containing protein n=1 Tax=Coniosporium apollinis TaxID=61459 RepID=A0ABQ9NN29_9PEZI|nr:hypothetical protein H2201_006925 [Coniosporium apollinis]
MPLRLESPLVRVEPASFHTIDTSNVENLMGMWSASHAGVVTRPNASRCPARPELVRRGSNDHRSRGKEKHITPIDLEKIVISIKEKKELEPLSPLPIPLAHPVVSHPKPSREDTTPRPSSPPPPRNIPQSSTSTVATATDSDASAMTPPVGSDSSTSTDLSSHSVVRGFSLGRVSSSFRSKTHLAPAPTPILKTLDHPSKMGLSKKKGATFTLGGSSDEDGTSSLETHMLKTNRSSLSEGLRRPGLSNGKTTSFNDKVTSIQSESYDSNDEALDSDDGEEEEPSESAIEDDDDEAWEDSESESESGPSSVNENGLFQRVESRPNLTSRRSMLTALMHEPDRQKALQNAASRSTPAMRRSRTSSPNGPSLASSPKDDESGLEMCGAAVPRSKPIIMTTSNVHPPALSPRTTRRNMLTTELTESLRKHLLWERQQKNATSNAALKRRHTSQDVKNLKQYPEPVVLHGGPPITLKDEAAKNNNSWNAFFDHGLQEYHEKGW